MKKKNMIIIGVIALILVVAVGYALFSDTLTINGTATAKGDFNLSYACEFVDEDISWGEGQETSASTGTGSCQVEGNEITTTSKLSKPTDFSIFKVTITNNGSIPAVLKTVDSSNNVASNMTDVGDVFYLDKTTALFGYYEVRKNNELISANGDGALEKATVTLQTGESVDFYIYNMWMDSDMLGLESQPELSNGQATMQYNMTLGFEQSAN